MLGKEPSADEACLARTIWHEARGESFAAKVAVRDIVKNRMRQSGKSCKEVVYAKGQFSWTAKKHKKRVPRKYRKVLRAEPVLDRRYTHFYNPQEASPAWAKNVVCKTLDKQKFCIV